MILALLESQRGKDAAAVERSVRRKHISRQCPRVLLSGAIAVLVGQPDAAADAFERAIAANRRRLICSMLFRRWAA